MRYTKRGFWLATVLAMLVAVIPLPAVAQEVCSPDTTSTESETLDNGVELNWIGSHWCLDAPLSGEFTATLVVTVDGGTVDLESLGLLHRGNTPWPGGEEPSTPTLEDITVATSLTADGFSVTVSGPYELVQTDEGPKLNIHLSALGTANATEVADPEENGTDPFQLGFNIHLRAAETENGDDGNGDNGNGEAAAENGTTVASAAIANNGNGDDDTDDASVETTTSTDENVSVNLVVNDGTSFGAVVTLGTNEDGQLIITVMLPNGVMIV